MEQKKSRLDAWFSRGVGLNRRERVPVFSGNRLSRLMRALGNVFAFTPARTFGYFLLTYGVLTVLLCLGQASFSSLASVDRSVMIIGLSICVFSAPFLLSDTPIFTLIRETKWLNALFFEFFCLQIRHESEHMRRVHPMLLILFAAAAAILGFFTSAVYVTLGLLALVLFCLSLSAPEMPFFLSLLLFPLFPLMPHASAVLGICILMSALSAVRKFILGNRMYFVTPYDLPLLLFGVCLLVSGFIGGEAASSGTALLYGLFMLGFPLAGSLVSNRRQADAALVSVVISSVPTAVYAIAQAIFGVENPASWTDASGRLVLTARVSATFSNPNVYAVFLLVALFFSLALAIEKKQRAKKILYAASALLNAAALVLTWSRGAWLAALFALLACILLRLRHRTGLLVTLIALVPHLLVVIPSSLLERIVAFLGITDTSALYRLSIWQSSLRMLADHPLTGIGCGADAFLGAFGAYAPAGVTAPHSHNLFLQIACQAGVIALLLLLAVLLLRALHLSVFIRYIRASSVYMPALFSTAALFGIIVFGVTDYPFANPTMFYLFWVVFGIGSATLRIAKQEREDLRIFLSAAAGAGKAELDIELDRW